MLKKKILIFVLISLFLGIYFYNGNVLATSTLNCSNTLRYGNSGTQVKILQTELNEVMDCKLVVDGAFGNATKNCVISFQKNNSLTQDAIVGPKSCNKLNELYLKKVSVSTEDETLKVGSSGTKVKDLQKKLNTIMGCNLSVDGSFGNETKTCVVDFQGKVGLSKDGVVGTKTKNKIEEVYNNRANVAFSKQGDEKTLDCHNNLRKGSYGTNVRLLQTELNKVTDCNLAVDGAFGNGTYNCVKKFQLKYVAPDLVTLSKKYEHTDKDGYYLGALTENQIADGVVGASTCSILNSEYLKNNNYIISMEVSQIRDGTSSTSFVIAYATYGMVFKNYGTVGSYYKIKYNDSYAYIKKSDVSSSAVVVDISNQTLKRYENGKLKMDTIVITGDKNKSWDTPQGAFSILSKARNIPLMNNSPVNFWIAFKGTDYGFHDANEWRDSGQFYETSPYRYINNGSHGCINMLENDAMLLYGKVEYNTPVYVVE